MARYCYWCRRCERLIEREYGMTEHHPTHVLCQCRHMARRSYRAETMGLQTDYTDPLVSVGAGVQLQQIPALLAAAKRDKIAVDVDRRTGNLRFHSRAHRTKCLKWLKLGDQDAGYSDPTPD